MDIFKLFGTIAINNTDANNAIDQTTDVAEGAESKLSSAFQKIGSAAIAVGQTIAVGLAVGVTAITALTTAAMKEYANYEQLIGGVETLYGTEITSIEEYAASVGKAADEVGHEFEMMMNRQATVLANANNAYQTAGMSATEYMDTVNGFAASLTSSLGEYEWQAAGYADMIVTDMADNANKMGTSMEAIQNAYSGFAKQNYTMLDNLKLGYGGTKEEMERLLRDAEQYAGYIEGSLDISSFADVAEAINIVQTELGITGTTAKEAATTISGSMSTAKAAFMNFLSGAGDAEQLAAAFTNAMSVVIENLTTLFPRLMEGLVELFVMLTPQIPVLFDALLPIVIDGVSRLAVGVASAMPDILAVVLNSITPLANQAGQIFGNFIERSFSPEFLDYIYETGNGIQEMTERMGDSIFTTFGESFVSIYETFEQLIPVFQILIEDYLIRLVERIDFFVTICEGAVVPIISTVIGILTELATTIATAVAPYVVQISDNFNALKSSVETSIINYILPAIQSFIAMLQQLLVENQDKLQKVGDLFSAVFAAIAAVGAWFVDIFRQYISPFIAWLKEIFENNLSYIKDYFQTIFDAIGTILDFFIALFQLDFEGMWEAVIQLLSNALDMMSALITLWLNIIFEFVSGIWDSIKLKISSVLTNIKNTINTIFLNIKTTVISIWTSIKDGLSTIVDGIKQKFVDGFSALVGMIKEPINTIIGYVNHVIDALNSISVDIPEWVPEYGGRSFGINIPNIAYLAKGGVITDPTLLGYNPISGRGVVAGEAGDEAIAPIAVLQGYIEEAVARQNYALVSVLERILEAILAMDGNMGENMREAISDMSLSVGEREFARLVKGVT